MLENKRHLLNNGFSFLAVEMGLQGDWSRDVDLQKCISRISKRPTFITLYYAHENVTVNGDGSLSFDLDKNFPICLGVYQVKGKTKGFTLQGLNQEISKKLFGGNFKDNKDYIDSHNEDLKIHEKQ